MKYPLYYNKGVKLVCSLYLLYTIVEHPLYNYGVNSSHCRDHNAEVQFEKSYKLDLFLLGIFSEKA